MSDVFIDSRDGNIYKTVEIGNQIWLAENLRFEGVECFAPNGNEHNIPKYGYLYRWENAMAACPSGWHLPTKEEFKNLLIFAGTNNNKITSPNPAFFKLVARSKLWTDYKNKGTDEFGFGALPTGEYYLGHYNDLGTHANFWSSTEYDSSLAYGLRLRGDYACVSNYSKDNAFSVRCIKD